jgi:hypothetical protein
MKSRHTVVALTLVCSFLLAAVAFGQEMPAPGTVIDKTNVKKYAHLFPPEFLAAFEDGFNGGMMPVKLVVGPPTAPKLPDRYIQLSEKNKGRCTVDKDGWIVGSDKNGKPFPDLDRNDKDFLSKLMWNYDNKYVADDILGVTWINSWEKRKGEKIRLNEAKQPTLYYRNRLYVDPRPAMPNPLGLYSTGIFWFITPQGMKDTMMMTYSFVDPKVSYETYLYIPSMRRTLRADAGQRSVPISGSVQSMDDFGGFSGRIAEFAYTLVGDQKVLVMANSKLLPNVADENNKKGVYGGLVPWHYGETFTPRDTWVIDIKAKDPKYPQSRKRIWIDKTTLNCYYCVAWDRAGKFWKIWLNDVRPDKMPDGDVVTTGAGQLGIDIQFGIVTMFTTHPPSKESNRGKYTYDYFTPQALLTWAAR